MSAKSAIIITLAGFAVLFGIPALFSFAETPESMDAPSANIYQYVFTSDTITNTEADTLLIPTTLISRWGYNWTISTTQLSGTQNLSCQLQESNTRTGTDWIAVGSPVTTSGSTDLDRAVGEFVYGVRQRLIITGSGTQSTRYTVTTTFKKH